MFFSFVAETPGGDVLPIALARLLKNVQLPDGYILLLVDLWLSYLRTDTNRLVKRSESPAPLTISRPEVSQSPSNEWIFASEGRLGS
jgi:hypothetical protein